MIFEEFPGVYILSDEEKTWYLMILRRLAIAQAANVICRVESFAAS